jgi:hypothetical protein
MVYIYLKSINKICVIVWCCSFANLASFFVSNSKGSLQEKLSFATWFMTTLLVMENIYDYMTM